MSALTHKEMTKHIRGRLKASKIAARTRLYRACQVDWIQVFVPEHGQLFTPAQSREIALIAHVNGLTYAQGMVIDTSDAYWSQTKGRAEFTFVHQVQS